MKRLIFFAILCLALLLVGCGRKVEADLGAPPKAEVEQEEDSGHVQGSPPGTVSPVLAPEHKATPELTVTGVVSPDVSRSVPAVSLASGRVVEIKARLGDTVKKGQLLLKVRSADISGAFSEYRQALADETLAKAQSERAKVLFEKGAIAKKDLEVAVDIDQGHGFP